MAAKPREHDQSLSRVQFFVTPWTVARQAPLPVGFSRRESWSGLPFPSQLWTLALLLIIKFSSFSPVLVIETWFLSPVETSAEFPIQHFHSFTFHSFTFLWGRQDFSRQSGDDLFSKICICLLTMLDLRCCSQTFSSCGQQGLLSVVGHGLLCWGFSSCRAQRRALGSRRSQA